MGTLWSLVFSKESVDQIRKKFWSERVQISWALQAKLLVNQSINVLTLTYVYQLWVMSKWSISQANTLVFSLAISQEVKVEGRCFGHTQLRGGLGSDLNTLEGLCPPAGREMPCSAPGRAGGSGRVEGGLGFLTIDTVPSTRTKISRKIPKYDIRLFNHMSIIIHAGLSTINVMILFFKDFYRNCGAFFLYDANISY